MVAPRSMKIKGHHETGPLNQNTATIGIIFFAINETYGGNGAGWNADIYNI